MTPVQLACYSFALAKLNEIRAACPDIGGDIGGDIGAHNLRCLIFERDTDQHAAEQAANTIESLGAALNVCRSKDNQIKHYKEAAQALRDCHK